MQNVRLCLCQEPGAERILTRVQSLFLGEEDVRPGVRLASALSDKPFTRGALEAHYSVHQQKQVTSSPN
ncbi:hypothetical protein CesoFtcFv8_007521 [Champsocephalus esox]|uniref:Uncharacterized protein n=1 Tax=Champsocephalus esox TaxID=159716 RepID=A0AAN8CEI3_9TELE|nr:hypothetical protein CesoFtcFv8_007521 [Champsocephalus esox]